MEAGRLQTRRARSKTAQRGFSYLGTTLIMAMLTACATRPSAHALILQGLMAPVPQSFVWGEQDPVLGQDLFHLPPLAAHQRLHRIAGAKHYLMIDHAKEISAVISQWLFAVAVRHGR